MIANIYPQAAEKLKEVKRILYGYNNGAPGKTPSSKSPHFLLVETIPIPNDVQQHADSKNFEVKAYKYSIFDSFHLWLTPI